MAIAVADVEWSDGERDADAAPVMETSATATTTQPAATRRADPLREQVDEVVVLVVVVMPEACIAPLATALHHGCNVCTAMGRPRRA
jgi:hypothetical protein